jgi:Leucine-rich repeat (LRR) protein
LVLHTPTPMCLRPLTMCINLIKLDLSNNRIEVLPHLGLLNHLKFLFLHNNRIEIEVLQRVFIENVHNIPL